MATLTLEKMAEGGIYDQVGGGFYRYSTDTRWQIPHFEKMLYDNGPLLHLYADAWIASGNPLFARIVEETATWVMREMQPEYETGERRTEAGYYSTLDADSENVEGRFYVWDRREMSHILSRREYAVTASYYGLSKDANFEHKHWHLAVTQPLTEVAKDLGITEANARQWLESARKKLFAQRQRRAYPERDEKTLTSWNGLMIKGMARAGRVFGHDDWVRSAACAVDFIRSTLWKNGRLLATWKDDKGQLNAYLDDYAFLLDGLLELMQTTFRQEDLDFAIALADVLLDQFEDRETGGFFFTSHDHEKLIHRPKPGYDNATPSGNGVAAYTLQRMGHLLGEFRYLHAAERTLRLFYPTLVRHPDSCCSLLLALEQWLTPPTVVILRGKADALMRWENALRQRAPIALVLALPIDRMESAMLPPSLAKPFPEGAGVNAWVCHGVKCLPEITDLQELLRISEIRGKIRSLFYN